MTTVDLTLWLSAALTSVALVRLLTVTDLIARLVAMNVLGAGTLLALVGLSVRAEVTDAVLGEGDELETFRMPMTQMH